MASAAMAAASIAPAAKLAAAITPEASAPAEASTRPELSAFGVAVSHLVTSALTLPAPSTLICPALVPTVGSPPEAFGAAVGSTP
jgi:hypothetical protein